MKKALILVLPLATVLIFLGVVASKKEHSLVQHKMQSEPVSQARDTENMRALGYVAAEEETPIVARKIIQSGEVTIQVKRYQPFFSALEKRMKTLNGYMANIQSRRTGDTVSSASLTLRVPPERLTQLVSWLREQGNLSSEKITSEDISEQYYDLKARLENARRFENRLLEMLKSETGNLQELILVEEKLNQTREQIEQMEGKLRYFDALTNLATLIVQVQVESHYVPPDKPTFVQRARHAWRDSIDGMFAAGQALAILIVAALPWMLPVLLLFLLLRTFIRSIKRRRNRLAEAV
jgi:hypothetical protein